MPLFSITPATRLPPQQQYHRPSVSSKPHFVAKEAQLPGESNKRHLDLFILFIYLSEKMSYIQLAYSEYKHVLDDISHKIDRELDSIVPSWQKIIIVIILFAKELV